MKTHRVRRPHPTLVCHDDLAIIVGTKEYTLISGHPMRSTPCLICREAVAGEPIMVVGIAAFDGDACACGVIGSDVYLLHSAHLPLTYDTLTSTIDNALTCNAGNFNHR